MKRLVILGSTGSIGTQTLEIVDNHLDQFTVEGLSANRNWQLLARQARKYLPSMVAIGEPEFEGPLRETLRDTDTRVLSGKEGINTLARMNADMVVVALVGISGLVPTINAIEAGRTIALANKETLVVGGELVMSLAGKKGVKIIPIDSEHSAIFQCLNGEDPSTIRRIHLTSSGGPFREMPREKLRDMTAGEALDHPTWSGMGKKVTIDSSTLMNKGFEVIEACHLFHLDPDQIKVLIHPQSIIHSMVEFYDGSIIAQLSSPDMRIPIQYALSYPHRLPGDYVRTDFFEIGTMTFQQPRLDAFPCLSHAFKAIKAGGTLPAVLNGANEVAVELFLKGKIKFTDISHTVGQVIEEHIINLDPDLEKLQEADAFARRLALELNLGKH